MSDADADRTDAAAPRTAGGLLRAARRAQGLHIAALAASIKVAPRKLEALEADQFDQLPDATFTRALAQTVCRSLKIDPAPVLALLPPLLGNRLDHVADGLNAPFQERSGGLAAAEWSRVANPAWWIALALLVGAGAIYLLPAAWLPSFRLAPSHGPAMAGAVGAAAGDRGLPAPGAGTSPGAAAALASATDSLPSSASASVPTPAAMGRLANTADASASADAALRSDSLPAPDAAASPPPPGILQLHVRAVSWVDVTDARGQVLLSRLVQANESVALDGVMPFKLKVGNAGATTVVLRGEPVELGPFTRDNVARLVLK